MKKHLFFIVCFSLLIVANSCAQKVNGRTITVTHVDTSVKDSIEYYETDVDTRQKNYLPLLLGSWNINVMKRQQKMDAEHLTQVYITFLSDSTFAGSAGCNRISGKYSLKGTSIKFKEVVSTKMACSQQEQENEFLRLLQGTVSAYTVDNSTLLLRDGSSNIVFEGSRRQEK